MSNKRSASGRADERTLINLKKRIAHFPKADGLTILSKREIKEDMRDIITTMQKPGSESSGDEEDTSTYLSEAQQEFSARKRRRVPSVAENRWVDELLYYNWRLSTTAKEMHEIVEDRRRAKNKYRAQRNGIIAQIQQSLKEQTHRKKILTGLEEKLEEAKKKGAAVSDKIKLAQAVEIIEACTDSEAKKKLKVLLEKEASESEAEEDSEDNNTGSKLLQFYSSFVEKVPRNQILTLSPIVETDIKCLVPGELSQAQLQYLRNMVNIDHWERDKNQLNRTIGEQARLQHQHTLLQERSRQQKKQLASRRVERVQMMTELNEARATIKNAETSHKLKVTAIVSKYQKMLAAQKEEIESLKEKLAQSQK